MISIGASTNLTYTNFSNGSYSTGWVSTLSGMTSTLKLSMTQNGSNILALRSYTSSISTSVNSGVSWSTLTGTGLPSGTPIYTTLAQSATGQYQLVAAGGLGLFYSVNYGTSFTASALNTTNPYTYIPFDGSTAVDVRGNATVTISGTVAYVAGQAGLNAIYLNNSAGNTALQYVRGTWTAPTNFTVSFWFNPQTISGAVQVLFSVGTTASVIAINASNQLYFTSAGGNSFSSAFATLTANTWYYLTAIYQASSTCTLYLNGSVVMTGTAGASYGTSTGYFGLGTSDANVNLAFNGYIDEFRLYTSAVTAAINPIPYFNNVSVSGTGQYMYATANNAGGLYSSSNYGVTWTQQSVTPLYGPGSWSGLTASNSGQYVVAETNYVSPQQSGLTATTWSSGGVTWTASASSILVSPDYWMLYYAFDSNWLGSSQGWAAANGNYNGATYTGSASTTVSGSVVNGDWLQIQSSVPLIMYSHIFHVANYANAVKAFVVAGSNDGVTWYSIQTASYASNPYTGNQQGTVGVLLTNYTGTQVLSGGATVNVTTTSYSTSVNAYTYFRIIGTSNFNGSSGYFETNEWQINFVGGHTKTTNFGSTWALSPYPATTISPNSASATSNSWTANGVSWTASGSTILNSSQDYYTAFDASYTLWGWVSAVSLYSNGTYFGGRSTTVSGTSYAGEYLQLQSSIPLVMYTHNIGPAGYAHTVKTYMVAGSNDGSTWYAIQSGTFGSSPYNANGQQSTGLLFANYTGSQSVFGNGSTVSVTTTAYPTSGNAYTYFRLIVMSDFPGGSYAEVGDWVINFLYPTAYPTSITTSGNGQYALLSNNQTLSLMNNYLNTFNTYTTPTLSSINAVINCASVSSTGQYMIVLTQGTTNNVYYSTNYGVTFTALTIGSSPMTSCAISYDGSYIAVSNSNTVYTLNTNTEGYSVAIGNQAGTTNQALNAVAIGNQAGAINQSANSVVLNASGSALNGYGNGLFVAPVASTASSSQTMVQLLGYGSDSQVTASAVYVGANGYVGIGTNFPTSAVHIHNNTGGSALPFLQISGGGNSGNTVGINFSPWYSRPGGTPLQIIGLDDGSFSAHLTITTAPTGSSGTNTATERLRITSGGYVGIGTTSPNGYLDVQGYIRIGRGGSNSYDGIQFMRGTTSGSNPNIRAQTNYIAMYNSTAGTWANDSAVGDMIFRTSSANFVWNNSAGSYSAMMLYSSPANILRIGPSYSTAGGVSLFSTTIPSTTGGYATSDGARIVFNNTYNGTAGAGMAANKIVLFNNNWLAGFGLEYGAVTYHSGGAHTFYINANNSSYGTQALILNNSGNVGIGSSSPQAKLDVNGNIRTNITYNQVVSHTLVSGTNTSTWYKIASFSQAAYGEFLFTWAVAGEHGQIRFTVSSLYNSSPNITIISSTYYSGPAIQAIRLALDPSSIYGTHYVEYYTNSSFYATVVLNCYLISNSPTHYPFSLLSLTAASSGFTYYNAWLTTAFQSSPAGKPVVANYSGYLGVGTTSPISVFNTYGGTTILNSSTYSNGVEYVSPAPALHLRAGNSATTQQIWECVGATTNAIACGGTAGLTYGTQSSGGGHIFRYSCTYNGDFTSTGSVAMIINNGGAVGMNTNSPAAPFHSYLGSKIVIQNTQNGGTNRGIYYWNDGDTNWVGYMGESGAGRSASGGTACTGAFGFGNHAIRNRVYAGSNNYGFIWENNSETCIMSIGAAGGGGGVKGQWGVNTLSPGRTCSVNGHMGSTDWLYIEGTYGMYWAPYGRGFASSEYAGNSYGTASTVGTGRNSWDGWGIGNNVACFMSNSYWVAGYSYPVYYGYCYYSYTTWQYVSGYTVYRFGIHDNQVGWAFWVPNAGTRRVFIMSSVRMGQDYDRLQIYANGSDTGSGYFYSNQGGGYGTGSDERIKKNIEPIPMDTSTTFIMDINPSFFCLKQETGEAGKHCAADGTETGELPSVCNCPQSGFIAQNVLAAAVKANVPKSVCNNWYDYEQELDKPDEERKALLCVNTVPVVSHMVNVVKYVQTQIDEFKQMKTHLQAQMETTASIQYQINEMMTTMNRVIQAI
jgi:hypothetical protein